MLDVLGVTDRYAVFAPITVDHAFIHKLPVLPFTNPSPMLAVRVAENPYWVLPVYAVNFHCPLVPALVGRIFLLRRQNSCGGRKSHFTQKIFPGLKIK